VGRTATGNVSGKHRFALPRGKRRSRESIANGLRGTTSGLLMTNGNAAIAGK
jgi:hypothetical protein